VTSYPAVKGKDLLAALRRAGFALIRTRGSHHFLRHTDGRSTVVPVRAGDAIGPGLPAGILCDGKFTREGLRRLDDAARSSAVGGLPEGSPRPVRRLAGSRPAPALSGERIRIPARPTGGGAARALQERAQHRCEQLRVGQEGVATVR
jgi:predicted RNA binding protein YcfA (HicA-like mRNA interferase family)